MLTFFIAVGTERRGPYTLSELAGQPLTARTPVWHRGLTGWTRAAEVPEIRSLLGNRSVEHPVPTPAANAAISGKQPARRVAKAVSSLLAGVTAIIVGLSMAAPVIRNFPKWMQEFDRPPREKVRNSSAPTSKSATPSKSTTIVPRADVDERLYLLYDVRYAYQFMATDASDPAAFATALGRQRHDANRRLEYVRAKKLDAELVTLYVDLVATIDAMNDVYIAAGRLSRDAVAQAEAIAQRADIEGGETLASAGSAAGPSGGLSLLAGGFELAKRQADSDQATEQAKKAAREAMDDLVRAADQKFSTYLARAEASANELGRRHGWSAAETGMVSLSTDMEQFHSAIAMGDADGVVAWMAAARKNRPRDPIPTVLACIIGSQDPNGTASNLAEFADVCYSTATLVPAGAAYDEDRATIVLIAAQLMKDAAVTEAVAGGSWVDGGSAHAITAVRWFGVAREYADLSSSVDQDGEFRLARAVALTVAGRPTEGLQQANAIHAIRKDFDYAYVMTALLTKAGSYNESLKWFAYLLSVCPAEMITAYRTDPALAALKGARREACDDLLRVKFEWNVQWGTLNDDIVLTNRSAFPLTNVVFNPRIENAAKVYAPELRVDRIAPGQAHKWPNAVSVTGSRYDRANATLACDQGR
ncbi:DUF4339 domain-containing protein [Humisphaera borealis]|uniref:DUF4339 domain-containing protein n=1 Tax=Humisphaera borealis TaxID=2807512 RepID=A0A7M2WZR1_9BACT|nr:DUF4339 domain-containing protein [Humisphaera borealis]QOV90965.1 DUF4339 domain-containing protein [Humisphaera borealis]